MRCCSLRRDPRSSIDEHGYQFGPIHIVNPIVRVSLQAVVCVHMYYFPGMFAARTSFAYARMVHDADAEEDDVGAQQLLSSIFVACV